jgi:anti-sigma B factor antagonist
MTLEDDTSKENAAPYTCVIDSFLDVSPLQISVTQLEDQVNLALAGELDGSTAPFLMNQFVDLNAVHSGDMVLDIAQLTFIDSTGLSVFVSQHKKLKAQGRRLVIFAPSSMARQLFDITGLGDVLSIEPAIQPE